jgi:hypothetical protein
MKRSVTLIVILLLIVSCGTTRKTLESTQSIVTDSAATTQEIKNATNKTVDTTRTEHGKITITEIEFFPVIPDAPPIADDARVVDTAKSIPARPSANVDLQDIGKINGAVKSIKQTVIESEFEAKGESKEASDQEQSKSNANVSRQETESQKLQEPAPDPYRWRYVFYIGLLVVAILLYLKRVPIINWVKKILSGLRKIF